AVLLAPSIDPPRLIVLDGPVTRGAHGRASGQSRTDGVEELLSQAFDLGAIHPQPPDALENGVVCGEGRLRRGGRSQDGDRDCGAKGAPEERESHREKLVEPGAKARKRFGPGGRAYL